MTNSSPPHSPPSSEIFDWRDFLIDPTIDMGNPTIMPDQKQVEESQKGVNLSPTLKGLPKTRKRKQLSEESKEKRKIASRKRSKRYRASQKDKNQNGEIDIETSKERAHIYDRRYREKNKNSFGFTSLNDAQMHQLRLLEKVGKLTPEQEKQLFDHRAKNNLRNKKWRAKKKLGQKVD